MNMPNVLPEKRDRMVLDLKAIGLPEVPLVGVYRLGASGGALGEHVHKVAMEICYLVSGQQTYNVGGNDYPLRGNDLFVTFPNERHGSGLNPMGKGLLYWLQVRPRPGRKFLLLSPSESRPLVSQLMRMPRRSFRGERQLQPIFDNIVRQSQSPPSPLRKLRVATLLLEFLQTVCDCSRQAQPPQYSHDIQRVLKFMAAHVRRDVSVDEMAAQSGLSTPRFKVKFKQQLGIPPREYFMRAKVHAAQEILRAGRSVTSAAMELGFSSSQYFATVFRRYTNCRPSSLWR